MKALFVTLLIALGLPLALSAAIGDGHVISEVEGNIHEAAENVHAEVAHIEKNLNAEQNKLTMITEKFGVSVPTLVAQMVNFVLVAFVLYRFAVKPIAATLDERQQKISEGLQYAEEMKTQLAEAERERAAKIKEAAADAQRILGEAREQSKEMIEQKTQEAAAQAEAMIRKAAEATELDRQKMLSEVRQEVARLVVVTSGKVLERELSDAEKTSYSDAAAKELAAN